MPIRCALVDAEARAVVEGLGLDLTVGLVHVGDAGASSEAAAGGVRYGGRPIDFELPLAAMGLRADDPTVLVVAASAGRCFPRELVLVAPDGSDLIAAAEAAGCPVIALDGAGTATDAATGLAELDEAEQAGRAAVGLGPHPLPWPTDEHYDPALLAGGDRRNVVDRYRYWSEAAIVADLDRRRQPVHVAVENWQHDLNIGTVVRNANAFNVAGVHIIGKRRWNRRGAMATDRYLRVEHHATVDSFASWAKAERLAIVGIDNVARSVPLAGSVLPRSSVLLFGQEGPGLSGEALEACATVCEIPQWGSTRSLNAGVASGIALYVWAAEHGPAWPRPAPVS